jgi:hypothetical protein
MSIVCGTDFPRWRRTQRLRRRVWRPASVSDSTSSTRSTCRPKSCESAQATRRYRGPRAATDFSELGNAAIAVAYAAASPGGTVHLLYVIKAGRPQDVPSQVFQPITETTAEVANAAETRLSELIPADAPPMTSARTCTRSRRATRRTRSAGWPSAWMRT